MEKLNRKKEAIQKTNKIKVFERTQKYLVRSAKKYTIRMKE